MTRIQQHHQQHHQDRQSRILNELSYLLFSLLRSSPSPMSLSDQSEGFVMPSNSPTVVVSTSRRQYRPPAQISPTGFALLLLGISLALMICGSVTFFIGFMLMPWVLGLGFIFYLVGIVSYLSMLGKTILCHADSPGSSLIKEIPSGKLL